MHAITNELNADILPQQSGTMIPQAIICWCWKKSLSYCPIIGSSDHVLGSTCNYTIYLSFSDKSNMLAKKSIAKVIRGSIWKQVPCLSFWHQFCYSPFHNKPQILQCIVRPQYIIRVLWIDMVLYNWGSAPLWRLIAWCPVAELSFTSRFCQVAGNWLTAITHPSAKKPHQSQITASMSLG